MSESANPDLEETNTATERAAHGVVGEQAVKPAQSLGRYMVLSKIGEGGMGQVYAAYDPKLDRRVALKLLHTKNKPGDRERLMREAKALARLSDPHVVTVHEVDEFDGRPLIAMEFVEGQTLKEWSQGHPVGRGEHRVLEALEILVQAGRGLVAAHAQGLVHRDFKPGNVLVGTDGRVRVADFGLAQAVDSDGEVTDEDDDEAVLVHLEQPLTRTGAVVGTPAYMAPEQFSGKRVDERCDQFSFCATAWEVLFGVRPYRGKRVHGLSAAFRAGTPHKPRDVVVPERVEKMLRKGLSIRPAARHEEMETLLRALQGELEGLRGEAQPNRRWGGWRYLGIAASLAFALAGGNWLYDASIVAACEEEGDEVGKLWNKAALLKLRGGMLATAAPYAPTAAEKATPWIDQEAEELRLSIANACLNERLHQNWDKEQVGKAQWCLEEARDEFEDMLEELTGDIGVVFAVETAANGVDASKCTDDRYLAAMLAPPPFAIRADIRRIQAKLTKSGHQRLQGQNVAALRLAQEAVVEAEKLDRLPLVARARREVSMALKNLGRYRESEIVGVQAFTESTRLGDWAAAATTANHLIMTVGDRLRRFERNVSTRLRQFGVVFSVLVLGLSTGCVAIPLPESAVLLSERLVGSGCTRTAAGQAQRFSGALFNRG